MRIGRIGRKKIVIPSGVTVTVAEGTCRVKGARGTLEVPLKSNLMATLSKGAQGAQEMVVTCSEDGPAARALHGTIQREICNAITGVTEMFQKVLEINGVGYRVVATGKNLTFNLGFSQQVPFALPEGIEASIEKQTVLTLRGCNKYLVGQVAQQIRSLRPPEPYKGKGIKYKDEHILRKEGKTGKKEKK